MELMTKKLSKKEARKLIYDKLKDVLSEFRGSFKEKKFETRLSKAAKLFANDVARSSRKAKKAKRMPEGNTLSQAV
jgi:hypothetical protein